MLAIAVTAGLLAGFAARPAQLPREIPLVPLVRLRNRSPCPPSRGTSLTGQRGCLGDFLAPIYHLPPTGPSDMPRSSTRTSTGRPTYRSSKNFVSLFTVRSRTGDGTPSAQDR